MRDEQRFLEAMGEHRRLVLRLVNLYADDADERQDLEQEVWLQALEGLAHLPWRGQAEHLALPRGVEHHPDPETAAPGGGRNDRLEQLPGVGHDPSIRNDDAQRLHRAAPAAETDRALIALHLEGYDHAEVGGILGLTANHVGVKLHRIKARLTELLKPD
ncbi:MAG: hypothetical protein R2810_15155 [Flavobacteriales bacterium]